MGGDEDRIRGLEHGRGTAKDTTAIPPVPQVRQAIDRIGARGHITFGGRLLPDAKGFPASAMAKKKAGDWRDPARVRSWATAVAADLRGAAQAG